MRRVIGEMPWRVRLCALWLFLLVVGAIFSWLRYTEIGEDVLGFIRFYNPDRSCNLVGVPGCETGAGANETPSFTHFLGTDDISRDIFSRIVSGAQVSLGVAVTAVAFGTIFGGLFGSIAGFYRGRTETLLMTAIDIVLAFPGLVLLLAVIALFEDKSLFVIALTIGVLSIAPYTRVARATALTVSRQEFVTAAEAIGTKKHRILRQDIIPNVLPTLLAYALVAAAIVIVLEGSLAFLGLSVEAPRSSWGQMIFQAQKDLKLTAWPAVWPSLALIFTVLSLNQVGDWVRKRTDFRSSAL